MSARIQQNFLESWLDLLNFLVDSWDSEDSVRCCFSRGEPCVSGSPGAACGGGGGQGNNRQVPRCRLPWSGVKVPMHCRWSCDADKSVLDGKMVIGWKSVGQPHSPHLHLGQISACGFPPIRLLITCPLADQLITWKSNHLAADIISIRRKG